MQVINIIILYNYYYKYDVAFENNNNKSYDCYKGWYTWFVHGKSFYLYVTF